jgi:hypothetical protein
LVSKNATSSWRIPWAGLLIAAAVCLSGCAEVAARSPLYNFKVRANQMRNEIKVIRPGELGPFLEGVKDEKLRYVVYRSLEAQRSRLRGGRAQWTPLDLVSLTETSKMDMSADYQPLRGVAKRHHLWARLESMEPGQIGQMMDGPDAAAVVAWVEDFESEGRPQFEGRLNRHDFVALQRYAMDNLPAARSLLRYTFEQDQRPGQVAGLLGREWSDRQLTEIMRLWCSSEGWTPLAHAGELAPTEQRAVKVVLSRLERSSDPLRRREAKRWGEWFSRRLARLASRR